MVFPNVYERCAAVVSEDNVVAVKGRLNFKEDEMPKLLAESVVPIEEAGRNFFLLFLKNPEIRRLPMEHMQNTEAVR